MWQRHAALSTALSFVLALLVGCGGSAHDPQPLNPAPLSPSNINLIFVASEDLAYQGPGDINSSTANLTIQGLQRSLLMAAFLQQKVLGMQNVTGIYALEPMTHLQTANNYPDMVGLETVQQFAMLNQVTLSSDQFLGSPYAGQSYPINSSYGGTPPDGVATPSQFCANCQGLDFRDAQGGNEALAGAIVTANVPGFHLFSAPWETVSALMTNINQSEGYDLLLPASYISPNFIYALSITPSGTASLITYDSQINPPATYPVLSPPPASTTCNAQTPFSVTVTGGEGGAVIPAGANTNETLYFVRHADAHPQTFWSDNNYIGTGQWRALALPNALAGKLNPTQVYSIDPGQFGQGSLSAAGDHTWSTVAPALTAEPYAIANNLPYNLVTGFEVSDPETAAQPTSDFFFNGSKFSNQTVLVVWAFQFIQPAIKALLTTYHATDQQLAQISAWPPTDYDSIWTVKLDALGNVTVSNGMCEGIDSAALPAMPPQF